jgi:hypothetical protein
MTACIIASVSLHLAVFIVNTTDVMNGGIVRNIKVSEDNFHLLHASERIAIRRLSLATDVHTDLHTGLHTDLTPDHSKQTN